MRRDLLALGLVVVACAVLGWWMQPHAMEIAAPREQAVNTDARPTTDAKTPSIAGVQLGMTRHEVQAMLGQPKVRHSLYKAVYGTPRGDVTVLYSSHPEAQRVNVVAGPVAAFQAGDPDTTFTHADIQAAYRLHMPYVSGLFGTAQSSRGGVYSDGSQHTVTLKVLRD